jgi:hypothetical protein
MFSGEIPDLLKAFYCKITVEKANNPDPKIGGVTKTNVNKEGREALSVELYVLLCEWFLSFGNSEGIFAY